MKFTSSLLLAAAVLAFSACSENTTETETTTTETSATETVATDPFAGATISDSVASAATNLDASAPAQTETQVFQGPNTVAGKPADAASAGVNPAHGQPGHDCALPVGAPLGSKPSGGATPQLQTTPATTTITPTPTPAAAPSQNAMAAGLNPAHGQPGHDCAIPVGAPLKK